MHTLNKEVVIIVSGPAGLTAAIYSARANLKPLLVDAPADAEKQTAPGGQLMITTDVENYPGFSDGIQGPDLMHEFRKQAERFGTEFMEAWITEVDLSERPFQLYTNTERYRLRLSSSPPAPRRSGSAFPVRQRCRMVLVVTAFRRVRRATGRC